MKTVSGLEMITPIRGRKQCKEALVVLEDPGLEMITPIRGRKLYNADKDVLCYSDRLEMITPIRGRKQ